MKNVNSTITGNGNIPIMCTGVRGVLRLRVWGGGRLVVCVRVEGGGLLVEGRGGGCFLAWRGRKGGFLCVGEEGGCGGNSCVCGGGRGGFLCVCVCVCVCVDRPASCVGGWGGGGEATTLQGLRW